MHAMPAIHLPTTPAFHLPPRMVLAALAIVVASMVAVISTMAVGGRDQARAPLSTDATRVGVSCDAGIRRDASLSSEDGTPSLAMSGPCQEFAQPRPVEQRGLLPAGRKPAAWYIGTERTATTRPAPTAMTR